MKDLRYILIDYGRFKDLETILKLKKIWKDSSQARHYTYFFMVIFILLGVAAYFKNMLLIIALLILSFLSLLPLLIQQDNKFSMFGAFPRWNALRAKYSKSQSEVQVYDFTKENENPAESNYSGDGVPEWFDKFLDEKGINPNNINFLIDELSLKYDYPVRKRVLNVILFFIAFFGWHEIKKIPWTIELGTLVLLAIIAVGMIIVAIETHYKSKKEAVHPVLFMKGKKEELIHDLNLMKIKWDAETKENNNK